MPPLFPCLPQPFLHPMLLSDFDFPFDPTLVADQPVLPRDQARLLALDRASGLHQHLRVADLPQLLRAGDLVIVNDTKVMQARVPVRVASTGKATELLFVEDLGDGVWSILIKGRLRPGAVLEFSSGVQGEILERSQDRTTLRVTGPAGVSDLMHSAGTMPLPPYIKRLPTQEDLTWYQTIFARREGAIAAPTAGLHFTDELMQRLAASGVGVMNVTLHVGPGTFRPVIVERITEHRMGAERVEVSAQTIEAIERTKACGGRVMAVGTTVVRALESAAYATGRLQPFDGPTELFISPGFPFRVVDALLTNFHLPRTTLLMLVSALVGIERLREAYREAVTQRYRFYSYGDAMLIGEGWPRAT
ncbi:MAG: tRNA preQ1(34) S-adenosylmethionine ribosyltransferase-isomerase QueA [Nitrospiraceae bacterium]|nr:tRNA preQ1(34) S-adenosylmethionine ribosyltransferase-isomerase QueA [Nitrospiraceae bacterium]